MPDSVLRKATQMILQGQEFMDELNKKKKTVYLLDSEIYYLGFLLFEDSMIIVDDKKIIKATNGQLDVSNAQKKELKDKYSVLKTNDRLKMGIFTTIIIGLVYVYIEKK